MANINDSTSKGILADGSSIIQSLSREERSGAFLAARDLPRACRVYEVARMTTDVFLWRLICQVHRSARLDTSGIAHQEQAMIDEKIAYHLLLRSCRIDYHGSMKHALHEE